MEQRPDSHSHVPPAWARPGNRWGPRVYWPMLCLSIGLLAWRVIDGDSAGRIAVTACLVLMWTCLIAANQAARRKEARRETSA
ncbi:hypothetical protein GCM10023084_62370 [Streptomyces lacrimifluminis]|uniref:Uncharacterized protein n=1 Tax=Streptomyces lacrimifluminis TaxID=1500077 RepID=A0A917L6E7_9ACTN|nr:hypothetical protein GCM10012282_43420 [Streptomyces lacrimifluminis]